MVNDTVEVGRTDMNGFFQIEFPISEKNIEFVFVGVVPTSIELVDTCNRIELVMMCGWYYDFRSSKRARMWKKRYKKLPEIYKQAFEKGIFETEYPCYNRDFEPLYLKK